MFVLSFDESRVFNTGHYFQNASSLRCYRVKYLCYAATVMSHLLRSKVRKNVQIVAASLDDRLLYYKFELPISLEF